MSNISLIFMHAPMGLALISFHLRRHALAAVTVFLMAVIEILMR